MKPTKTTFKIDANAQRVRVIAHTATRVFACDWAPDTTPSATEIRFHWRTWRRNYQPYNTATGEFLARGRR
jgi:hypothetical protein